jgi:hypothetical protein
VLRSDLRDNLHGLGLPALAGAGRLPSAARPAIDDQPRQESSFGAGMRRAQHRIGDIEITPGEGGAGHIRAVAAITFPARRSRRSPARQSRPHLSTLDALVLALQAAEAYLTHSRSLTGAQRRASWVRRIDLRAGASPLEELGDVPLQATHRHTVQQEGGCAVSAFDCRVGTIKVSCEIEHAAGQVWPETGVYADIEEILGPPETRYYGAGWRSRALAVRDIELQLPELQADADFAVLPVPDDPACEGLGADYQPVESAVDAVLGIGQLAQALLYELDGIDPQRGAAMWMRRISALCGRPGIPASSAFLGVAKINRTRLVKVGETTWRTADLRTAFGGMTGTCSLALQIPQAA